MEDKLSIEEVRHVASLARIGIEDDEIASYQVKLKQILNEIEKIQDVVNYDEEFMITPIDHECDLREDKIGDMLTVEEALKNVPRKSGNYVEVPVVINE